MANILDQITNGNQQILIVDADPSTTTGVAALQGSIAIYTDGTTGYAWLKTGSSNTGWDKFATVNAGNNVQSGTAGKLTLYPSTGFQVGTEFVQNTFNTDVSIANSATRSVALSYVIPNPGDAVSSANFVLDQGSQTIAGVKTFSSPINAGGNAINGVGAPSSSTDAATKGYVDGIAQGISWKNEVQLATTANVTLSGEQTIDGVLTSASRILVKNQTTASQNGIYVTGTGAWTRAVDAQTGAELVSAAVFVNAGSVNASTGWVVTTVAPITLASTAINWVQFSGAGSYSAGNGLTLSGTQFAINLGTNSGLQFVSGALTHLLAGSTLSSGASGLQIAAGGVTNTEISASAAIALTKLAALTANTLVVANGSGAMSSSAGSGYVKVASGVVSYVTQVPLSTDVTGVLPQANGGTGISTTGSANQVLGMNAAASGLEYKTISGTTNQVTVTQAANSVTLALPQNIHSAATPTFASETLSGAGAFLTLTDTTAAMTSKQSMATVSTSNATVTTLATLATTSDSVAIVEVKITAFRTGGTAGATDDSAVFARTARIKNIAGTASVLNLQSDYTSKDQSTWNVAFTPSGANILVAVTGAANNSITWKALITQTA